MNEEIVKKFIENAQSHGNTSFDLLEIKDCNSGVIDEEDIYNAIQYLSNKNWIQKGVPIMNAEHYIFTESGKEALTDYFQMFKHINTTE